MVPERSNNTEGDGGSGLLARGWTPSVRPPSPCVRATVLVALGLLAVLNPLVGGLTDAVGLTGTAEYAAVEVTPNGGQIAVGWVAGADGPERSPGLALADHGGLTLVDCYAVFPSARCALESPLTEANLTVEAEPFYWGGYAYHDRFYERTATERGPRARLGLRRVAAEAALADIAVPARDWSDPVRRAVEDGSVTVREPLVLSGAVLERDGSYYAVVPTGGEPRDEPMDTVPTVVWTAAGVLLIQRGFRVGGW